MRRENPFGDEAHRPPTRPDPFGEEPEPVSPGEAATRLESAARRIRGLRSRVDADGLTPAAARDLIYEVAAAFEVAARSLREIDDA